MNRRQREAIRLYKPLLPLITELIKSGATLEEVADELNRLGHRTVDGGSLHKVAVHRILARFRSNGKQRPNPNPTWRKGLTPAQQKRASNQLDERLIFWSQRGKSKEEIAEKLQLSINSVRRRFHRLAQAGRIENVDERRKAKAAESS